MVHRLFSFVLSPRACVLTREGEKQRPVECGHPAVLSLHVSVLSGLWTGMHRYPACFTSHQDRDLNPGWLCGIRCPIRSALPLASGLALCAFKDAHHLASLSRDGLLLETGHLAPRPHVMSVCQGPALPTDPVLSTVEMQEDALGMGNLSEY